MIRLENMRPGEELKVVIRRHWIALVLIGFYFFVALLLTVIILFVLGMSSLAFFISTLFWLFFSVFIYIEWLNFELDLLLVTNNRIIGVDQISFLNRKVTECNLGQVQEVNSQVKGVFANIFNYGTIDIQTAGATTTLTMGLSPDAGGKSRLILNIVDEYRDSHGGRINNNNNSGHSKYDEDGLGG